MKLEEPWKRKIRLSNFVSLISLGLVKTDLEITNLVFIYEWCGNGGELGNGLALARIHSVLTFM